MDKYPGNTIAEKELNRTIANFQSAKDAGIRIVVGSDSFCSQLTPYGEYSLKEIYAINKAGLTPMETIVAATRDGADMLKVLDITGTLEEEKWADLIVLEKNPLDDIENIRKENMAMVMKEGNFIKR